MIQHVTLFVFRFISNEVLGFTHFTLLLIPSRFTENETIFFTLRKLYTFSWHYGNLKAKNQKLVEGHG